MQEYLSNFSNPMLSNQEHASQLMGTAAALHQVELVASIETLRMFRKVQSCFNRLSLDLLEKKLPTGELSARVNEMKASIQNHAQEREQLSGILQSPASSQDPQTRQSLMQRYAEVNALIEQEMTTENQLAHEFADHQQDLMLAVIDALTEMGAIIAPAVVEVRRELKLDIDSDAYLQISNESNEFAKQRAAKMIEDIKARARPA